MSNGHVDVSVFTHTFCTDTGRFPAGGGSQGEFNCNEEEGGRGRGGGVDIPPNYVGLELVTLNTK